MEIIKLIAPLLAACLAGNVWLARRILNVRRACRAITAGR